MYQDARISLLECGCKQIELGGTIYLLDDSVAVSRGSSCLVYYAWQTDTEGLSRRVLLKEFYPLTEGCAGWRQDDGSLLLPDGLQSRMDRFLNSYEKCKELFNEDTLNQYIVQVQSCPKDNGTAYMVVDYSSGITMDKYMLTCSLFDFFKTVRNLSGVLGALHRSRNQNGKGYVHMDIKPGNILVLSVNPEHLETRELCRLLDTDSFIHKESVNSERDLSGTPGYTAPEVMVFSEASDNFLLKEDFRETGERADMYSFGAVIYEFIFEGELPKAPYEICHSYEDRLEKCLQKRSRYIPYKAISLIRDLLKKTLAKDPYDRYENMSEIGEVIEKILKLIDTGKVQILDNCRRNPDKILGREQKILEMREKLTNPRLQQGPGRVVIVTGIGGIGKSSLAREYATVYAEEYDIKAEVSAASARDAVQRIRIEHDPTDGEIWQEDIKMNPKTNLLMNLCDEYRTLLIVNDYDTSDDPNFDVWKELGCDVILTSRHDWTGKNRAPVVELKSNDISTDAAKYIFYSYYLQNANAEAEKEYLERELNKEDKELTELLRRIECHALTVKLIAKYMSPVRRRKLLPSQILKDRSIFEKSSPVHVDGGKDKGVLSGNVYKHLNNLFRKKVEELLEKAELNPDSENGSLAEKELDALRNMTLIPSAYGICADRFEKWTGLESEYLDHLVEAGWLEYYPHKRDLLDKNIWQGVYIMPTVIQESLREQAVLNCCMDKCVDLVDYVLTFGNQYYTFLERKAFCEQLDLLVHAFRKEKTKEYMELLLFACNENASVSGDFTAKETDYLKRCNEIYNNLQMDDQNLKIQLSIMHGLDFYHSSNWCEVRSIWEFCTHLDMDLGIFEDIKYILLKLAWGIDHVDEAVEIAKKMAYSAKERRDLFSCDTQIQFILIQHLRKTGCWKEAEVEFEHIKQIYSEEMKHGFWGFVTPSYIYAIYEYGCMKLELGETDTALLVLLDGLAMARECFYPKSSVVCRFLQQIANAYVQKQRLHDAVIYRMEAAEILEELPEWDKEQIAAGENLLHLALDNKTSNDAAYLKLSEQAFEQYNLVCDEIKIHTSWDLCGLYYKQIEQTMQEERMSLGLEYLERWLYLLFRMRGESAELAAHYSIAGNIYDAIGLPRRSELCISRAINRTGMDKDQLLIQAEKMLQSAEWSKCVDSSYQCILKSAKVFQNRCKSLW